MLLHNRQVLQCLHLVRSLSLWRYCHFWIYWISSSKKSVRSEMDKYLRLTSTSLFTRKRTWPKVRLKVAEQKYEVTNHREKRCEELFFLLHLQRPFDKWQQNYFLSTTFGRSLHFPPNFAVVVLIPNPARGTRAKMGTNTCFAAWDVSHGTQNSQQMLYAYYTFWARLLAMHKQ